jgi:hypothetical protein
MLLQAAAATDEQRSRAVAARQAMLANWEGSASQVSYRIDHANYAVLVRRLILRRA